MLAFALQFCVYTCFALWVFLMSTVCSAPKEPDAVKGNTVTYSCHGSTVFITSTQDILLKWLIPFLVIAGVCGLWARRKAKMISEAKRPAS
jgi:hypothetical protein